jgi:hypothetical protein
MIEYRKHKSGRQFFRVNGYHVTRIINKESSSQIDAGDNRIVRSEGLDKYESIPSTEQEFKEQLELALDRIQKMKV